MSFLHELAAVIARWFAPGDEPHRGGAQSSGGAGPRGSSGSPAARHDTQKDQAMQSTGRRTPSGAGQSRSQGASSGDAGVGSKLSAQQIAAATGSTLERAQTWRPHLIAAMERFDITTPERIAAFLAQIGHESGRLARVEENLMYSAERLEQVFPRYFANDAEVRAYERKPEAIASRVYANRLGNGPEESRDGWRYRGRGLIQITGRTNYEACGRGLGLPLADTPDLLADAEGAAMSAAWYWSSHGCNELADRGDMTRITRVINGGTWGLEDRLALFEHAKDALHIA